MTASTQTWATKDVVKIIGPSAGVLLVTDLGLAQFGQVRLQVVDDAVDGAGQRHAADQQNQQQTVGKPDDEVERLVVKKNEKQNQQSCWARHPKRHAP